MKFSVKGHNYDIVIEANGPDLVLTEHVKGRHIRTFRASRVDVTNYENKRWQFVFSLEGPSGRQGWDHYVTDRSSADALSNLIHSTQTTLRATFVADDMLRYSPCEKKTPAKPVCEECYGTGYQKGFGAPCSKRCAPCS